MSAVGLRRRSSVTTPRRRPLRYYSITSTINAIDAATTIDGVVAACSDFGTVYDLTVSAQRTATTFFSGTYEASAMGEEYLVNVKHGARALVREFSKYPPSFVVATVLFNVVMCRAPRKLGRPESEFVGGSASGADFYFDATYTASEDGYGQTINHEFAHIFANSWPSDYSATEADWVANNPAGFAYSTSAPPSDFYNGHPNAFMSNYATTSRNEDWAETHALRALTRTWPYARKYLNADGALFTKSVVQDTFLNSKNAELDGSWYRKVNQ